MCQCFPPVCVDSGISHLVIVISNNSNNHGKPMVHVGRPVEEGTVAMIYLGSVSTALVDKFRISPSRQNRKSCQNIFYLQEEIRSVFILNETSMQSRDVPGYCSPRNIKHMVPSQVISNSSDEQKFGFSLEKVVSSSIVIPKQCQECGREML